MISKSAIDNELANRGAAAAAASTPAVEVSTSQNYDVAPQNNYDNPYADNSGTPSNGTENANQQENKEQDALVQASQESEKAPEPEQPRNTNAQQALADTQTQAQPQVDFNIPDNFDPSTLPANFWSMSDAEQSQYLANTFGVNTPTQTPTQTAPQQSQQTAQNDEGAAALQAASNTVDPNGIYDPSKTYGRQENGSYVFSNSAAQLQRDLNRLTNAGLTVDGYFGEKTQQALNNYLSQFNQSQAQTPASGTNNATETAGADALAASATEAGQIGAQSAPVDTQRPSKPDHTPQPAHDDAWYAEQYENITGNAPRTDILTPERIRDFVDSELAKRNNQDVDIDEAARNAWNERQAAEEARQNEINDNRDEAFTPRLIYDLKNGKSVEQILNEGDQSYNRWIQDNWDELSYTYNLGENFPTANNTAASRDPINYNAMADELNQMDRNDWYQRPEAQSPFPTPTSNGYVSTADFNANDYRNQLEQMENEPARPMTGNSMSAALENRQPDRTMPRGYSTPANESLVGNSYSEARSRAQGNQEQDTNIFREDYQSMLEDMENEEPTSTIPDVLPTPKAGASMAGNSYSRALADNQARPDTNIFRQDAPDVDEFRRAYEESVNRQSSSPDVRYGQQFMDDMRQLRQQFPTYSDTALFDMALFNEEMRNGQSSYYKWMANQLG